MSPIDYKRDYPPDWKEISLRIRKERAQDRCECHGECGLHKGRRCEERNGEPAKWAKGKVVLTVAHVGAPLPDGSTGDKHNKHDVRDENLRALCQRCHLRLDLNDHITNRKYGRNWRRDQTKMFT